MLYANAQRICHPLVLEHRTHTSRGLQDLARQRHLRAICTAHLSQPERAPEAASARPALRVKRRRLRGCWWCCVPSAEGAAAATTATTSTRPSAPPPSSSPGQGLSRPLDPRPLALLPHSRSHGAAPRVAYRPPRVAYRPRCLRSCHIHRGGGPCAPSPGAHHAASCTSTTTSPTFTSAVVLLQLLVLHLLPRRTGVRREALSDQRRRTRCQV